MAGTTTFFKYTLLPGILPRLQVFFGTGFSYTAYLIAVIYSNVRLLPRDHPYLNPANMGRFGVRHVVAEASRNLEFSLRNIDQVIVFFTILGGLFLLGLQIALAISALLMSQPVLAGGGAIPAPLPHTDWRDLFTNPSAPYGSLGPNRDIAFILMDQIFGLRDIFGSCVAQNLPCFTGGTAAGAYPWPFHLALHRLASFYTSGVFFVGVFVVLYYITTTVLETAQSGTPFGQRFNKAWVPIRLIFFFALLIPLQTNAHNPGLNMAQIVTFLAAKYGSNFATNGWLFFSTGGASGARTGAGTSNSFITQNKEMIARATPSESNIAPVIQFMHTAQTCRAAYQLQGSGRIDAYIVRSAPSPGYTPAPLAGNTSAVTPDARTLAGTSYQQALSFSSSGNITVAFGLLGTADPATGTLKQIYLAYKGGVMPYCGSINVPIASVGQPGADVIQEAYYDMVNTLWTDPAMIRTGECTVQKTTQSGQADGVGANCVDSDDQAYVDALVQNYKTTVSNSIQAGFTAQMASGAFTMAVPIIERGWAGAAIWYNKIAEMNGAITAAVQNAPKSDSQPMLLEQTQQANRAGQSTMTMRSQFSQASRDLGNTGFQSSLSDTEREMIPPMREAFELFSNPSGSNSSSGNPIIDTVNGIFGTSGLFEMRNNTDVHPLAQLSALGKGLIDAATRNAVYATALAAGKGIIGDTGELAWVGQLAKGLSDFLFATVMMTLAIGIILYYVLPFMPFIYFFFAVGSWIKSIFEAFVAMPLWALSHVRIDGEGLPGPGATNGYFLLLEIFLRPIMIVMGFIIGISAFSALVSVLNGVFPLVVANLAGHNPELEAQVAAGAGPAGAVPTIASARGTIDQFFFTVMYAIICYMMGLSCFKLVDQLPNNIMRWMGVSVSTFASNDGDPAADLSSNVYRTSSLTVNQLSGQTQGNLAILASTS